ncbi:SDR family NAD(P)-dependent oxidoreductase [Ornithinimicrobium sp. Y1694]|uniref:SDR family NAD(P)-dependent oxidoreductase n=1 Tax=Ornithinimicrobium sp. Y1694 TaxID=3418590 RepID=UPI003CEC42C4
MAKARRLPDWFIRVLWALGDGTMWAVAVIFAVWLRFTYDLDRAFVTNTWIVAGVAGGLHILIGLIYGPYLIRHVRGSFEEVVAVARAAVLTSLALGVWAIWLQPVVVPRSTPAVAGAMALVLMLATRMVVRATRSRQAARREVEHAVIVYGAGVLGRRLVANLLEDDQASFRPVAFLDDDRRKRRLRIEGVPVRGDLGALRKIARRYDATHLAVAIPASAQTMRELNDLAHELGLTMKVLPTVDRMMHSDPRAADLRDVDLEDLLGRRATSLDQAAIAAQITGKVVLVTGAGGSIGSELCRQIHQFRPARLLMMDRDESGLHGTELSIKGRSLMDDGDLILADIRDPQAMDEVFARHRPDVVFHAAALKHLPLLEAFPQEAWRVNVLGTLNVLRAAARSGVGTFVNISSDKAAKPVAVLGYTKRIAERLTSWYAYTQPGRYVSVRFGNVLGSRGSVVPTFTEQIRRGGPVTLTHEDVQRYFMLIPEACELVMQAASMGSDGDVLVLDMGSPVRIASLATTLIELSGRKDVKVEFTGLRQSEKLSEDLFGDDPGVSTAHELVQSVQVPPMAPDELPHVFEHPGELVAWMRSRADVVSQPVEHRLDPADQSQDA